MARLYLPSRFQRAVWHETCRDDRFESWSGREAAASGWRYVCTQGPL